MSEVEKIMDIAEGFADIYSEAIHEHYKHSRSRDGLAPMREELHAAVEALVAERDDWKRAIMERRNSIAKVLDEKADERREREADRQRFPDPAFNEWLDEGISDAGHTVWDATENIADAWAGWNNRGSYRKSQAQPQERECECCNGTGAINERLGGEWNSNPAAKCPECDGAGVRGAKAQVQQEQCNVRRLMRKINGEFIPASEFFTGEPPSDWVALVNTYPGEWGIQRRVTGQQIADGLNKALAGAKAQVQQEPNCWRIVFGSGRVDYTGVPVSQFRKTMWDTAGSTYEITPLYAAPVGMDKLRGAAQEVAKGYVQVGSVDPIAMCHLLNVLGAMK